MEPCPEAVKRLDLEGLPSREITLDLSEMHRAFAVLRGHHLLTVYFARRTDHRTLGQHLSYNLREAERTTGSKIAEAARLRHQLRERFRALFSQIDYLLTPTVAVAPFPVENLYPSSICGQPMRKYYDWLAPTSVFSLTGYPVVSVPCGLDADRMPVGLQIIGSLGDEGGVLALARIVQVIAEVPPFPG